MTDTGIGRNELVATFAEALTHGYAALFAGAGLSRAAGFVDWKGLLTDFANELGLDLDIEADLVTVAQYHLNHEHQVRTRLNDKLVTELGTPTSSTMIHELLATLPIHTYWTSNFDSLIENSLRASGKTVTVRNSTATLTRSDKKSDVDLYKLHGDLSDPNTIIITHDDYVNYVRKYPGFRDRLRSDLTSKTFLFLGFSFSDPHLDLILSELKRDLGPNIRTHLNVMRREQQGTRTLKRFRYALNRQRLQIEDLERYGVKTFLVNDFKDIPQLIKEIQLRYLRSQIFVSGAAADFDPRGRPWIDELGSLVGREIVRRGFNLISGFGLGVGPSLISGGVEELYRTGEPNLDHRLLLRPFPISIKRNRANHFSRYRKDMLATAGFAIFISGNRASTKGFELSPGVLEEFEIAAENKAYPLPIGSTGWQAEVLWRLVEDRFDEFFPKGTPRRPWVKLNTRNASPPEIVDALFTLIDYLRVR